jgi:O-acetylserine/cysteine efflux transporter
MLGERLRAIQQAGLVIGFAGVYLIIAHGLVFRITTGVVANATVITALTFECCAAVVAKRLTDTYRWVVVLTLEFGIGALLLMPGAVWEMSRLTPSSVHWTVWANLAYMSLLCSFFCYAVWYWLLPKHPVSSMAGFLFIQPMMGPVLAWAFRHEKMGYWTLIGALLVVVGVSLVTVLKPRNKTLDAATSMPPQHGG